MIIYVAISWVYTHEMAILALPISIHIKNHLLKYIKNRFTMKKGTDLENFYIYFNLISKTNTWLIVKYETPKGRGDWLPVLGFHDQP